MQIKHLKEIETENEKYYFEMYSCIYVCV